MRAADVLALDVGDSVYIRKEWSEPILCTVAYRGNPANKFLTYRDKGQIKRFAIRDYPGTAYFQPHSKRKEGTYEHQKDEAQLQRPHRRDHGSP